MTTTINSTMIVTRDFTYTSYYYGSPGVTTKLNRNMTSASEWLPRLVEVAKVWFVDV